jgi:hypothetical protein
MKRKKTKTIHAWSNNEQLRVEEAKEAAVEVLLHNISVSRSGLPRTAAWGYPEPYTRDLMISALGLLINGRDEFVEATRVTLAALAQNQSGLGHIPSLADDPNDRGASDTTPWFLIGVHLFRQVTDQRQYLQEATEKALTWMTYHRHKVDLEIILDEHYDAAAELIDAVADFSIPQRRLLGSYFTMEYDIESAALFNPSIVPHPNQNHVPPGGLRFIMSLRATGEGHLSSIVFRTGVIQPNHTIDFFVPNATSESVVISIDRLGKEHLRNNFFDGCFLHGESHQEFLRLFLIGLSKRSATIHLFSFWPVDSQC